MSVAINSIVLYLLILILHSIFISIIYFVQSKCTEIYYGTANCILSSEKSNHFCFYQSKDTQSSKLFLKAYRLHKSLW